MSKGLYYILTSTNDKVCIEISMAPQVGFEPTTDRLTADSSTTELLRNNYYYFINFR